MTGKASVTNVDALQEMNSQLRGFSTAVADELRSAQNTINETIEWLAQRENHWQRESETRYQRLLTARRAYDACRFRPRGRNDPVPTCSAEASAVREAEAQYAKAQQELAETRKWQREVNTKVSHYMVHARRVTALVNDTVSRGSTFLRTKLSDLGAYAAGGLDEPAHMRPLGGHGSEYTRARHQMMVRALDDPLVGRDIKGWVRSELRRIQQLERAVAEGRPVEHPHANHIRMPAGIEAGHRIPDVDTAANLRLEDAWVNGTRYQRARRMGLAERIR